MTRKATSVILGLVFLAALPLMAQPEAPGRPVSVLENIIWSVAPFLIVAGIVWWFFMGAVRKMHKRTQEHNQRVQVLLERIATALEKKDKDVV
jgi:membrane protein implicated in regulation of membrane protease activity